MFPGSGTSCGVASCSNGQLTNPTCNGVGACGGTPAACAGGFVCASATTCKTACASDADCQSASSYCKNPGTSGTCAARGGAGTVCSANDQCVSGVCGINGLGSCCAAACSPTGGACGAIACTASGACVYPSGACGAAACAGAMLTPAPLCGGSGTWQRLAGAARALSGPPRLRERGPHASTGCGGNNAAGDAVCAAGYWCDGVGAGACQARQAAGGACTRSSQCINTCSGTTCT